MVRCRCRPGRQRRCIEVAPVGLVLVDPAVEGGLPADELLGLEPEGDLLLGGFHRVRAVGDVTAENRRGRSQAARRYP